MNVRTRFLIEIVYKSDEFCTVFVQKISSFIQNFFTKYFVFKPKKQYLSFFVRFFCAIYQKKAVFGLK